jgi:uncharacterized protein DUF4262
MRTALDAPDESLDVHEKKFVANIREHGWFRTNVLADGANAGFSYTTGFWLTLGFPDIIVFSLPSETAHAVFWDIFRDVRAGKTPPVGQPADLFANMEGFLFPVGLHHYAEHLGWSRWFYGSDDFPCLQLVWPDTKGVFPWQPGADEGVAKFQPDLTANGWGGVMSK